MYNYTQLINSCTVGEKNLILIAGSRIPLTGEKPSFFSFLVKHFGRPFWLWKDNPKNTARKRDDQILCTKHEMDLWSLCVKKTMKEKYWERVTCWEVNRDAYYLS